MIKTITTNQEFYSLKEKWIRLIDNCEYAYPCSSWYWHERWWHYFSEDAKLLILTVEDAIGELSALAPFMVSEQKIKGFPVRLVSFWDNGLAPRNNIIIKQGVDCDDVLDDIFSQLRLMKKEWDIIRLSTISQDVRYSKSISKALANQGLKCINWIGKQSPYTLLNSDFSSYFNKQFKSKTRNDIRRKLNKVKKNNKCYFKSYTSEYACKDGLQIAFEVSSNSWKSDIGADMTATSNSKGFYCDITREFSINGQVTIEVMFVNDVPVAAQYQLLSSGTIYMLTNDFAKNCAKFSPGANLMYYVIEKSHQNEVNVFDFCGQAYDYKKKWSTNLQIHRNIEMFNSCLYSTFIYHIKASVLPFFRELTAILKTIKKKCKSKFRVGLFSDQYTS